MKKLIVFMAVTLALTGVADAKRTHVRIHKPVQQPVIVPFLVVPPFAVAFDLIRRTSCDPTVAVATGPDDPGFTSFPVGNYLIPAINRSECMAQPK